VPRPFDNKVLAVAKAFSDFFRATDGRSSSNVPLINKTGMFDLTGARKLLPRSGLPHESQTSGNTMSAASLAVDCIDRVTSRRLRGRLDLPNQRTIEKTDR
jgi:hypothetical protein